MTHIADLLKSSGLVEKLAPPTAEAIGSELSRAVGMDVYPASVTAADGAILALARRGLEKRLLVAAEEASNSTVGRFVGRDQKVRLDGVEILLRICPTDAENAQALRDVLPYTGPKLVGLATSFGFGDRLGVATPGHVQAVAGSGVVPFFAQQSIRELTRTQRTAQEVMDAASWAVFQTGWREGFGADADHLKTTEDVDLTAAAGFTMFTIDPGDHVDNAADTDEPAALQAKFEQLPWADLQTTAAECRKRYLEQAFEIEGIGPLRFSEETLLRAACKYGAAVAHTAKMARHIEAVKGAGHFEIEMSVDETLAPTTPLEHFFVASELKRLSVKVVSLAPRFIGEFEKAVDYRGDLAEFEKQFAQHAAIARHCGPYKISIHSGSDKFSIYPIVAKYTAGLVHVKTAGTSYLEALRVVARHDPEMFREILDFAFGRFDEDKASYHVSTDLSKVPRPQDLADGDLESVLSEDDGRQLLHITFGSVLTGRNADGSSRFRDRLLRILQEHEQDHYACLAEHLGRHVRPFAKK